MTYSDALWRRILSFNILSDVERVIARAGGPCCVGIIDWEFDAFLKPALIY